MVGPRPASRTVRNVSSPSRRRCPPDAAADGVEHDAQRHARRAVEGEVERTKGEVEPASAQANATVTRAHQELVAQELAQAVEHGGVGGRVEAMAAVIHALPGDLEAPRVAAHLVARLEDDDLEATLREREGGAESGRPRAEHDDADRSGFRHARASMGGGRARRPGAVHGDAHRPARRERYLTVSRRRSSHPIRCRDPLACPPGTPGGNPFTIYSLRSVRPPQRAAIEIASMDLFEPPGPFGISSHDCVVLARETDT